MEVADKRRCEKNNVEVSEANRDRAMVGVAALVCLVVGGAEETVADVVVAGRVVGVAVDAVAVAAD